MLANVLHNVPFMMHAKRCALVVRLGEPDVLNPGQPFLLAWAPQNGVVVR